MPPGSLGPRPIWLAVLLRGRRDAEYTARRRRLQARVARRQHPDLSLVPGGEAIAPRTEPDPPRREVPTVCVIGIVFGLNLTLVGLAIVAAGALGSRPAFSTVPLGLGLLASGGVTLGLLIAVAYRGPDGAKRRRAGRSFSSLRFRR